MSEIKFTNTHEWLQEEQEEVIVGITEHAQQLLGDMVFVELPPIGKEVAAGEELGVVESVKAASDFYAPVDGRVTAVNELVANEPALVNSEPFKGGWLVKILPRDRAQLNDLLSAEQYTKLIEE